jgi:transmembrane sensor
VQACLPPDDSDAAAVDWIVRLHSGRASAADRRDFAAWRRHSPGNERAALAAERLWEQLGDAGRPLLAQVQARPWRPTRRRLLQAGLATAAAAGGLALLPRYPLATFATATGESATGESARVTVDAGATAELDARTGLNVARENAPARVEVLGGRALLATSGDRPLAVLAAGHEAVLRGATELEVDLRQGDPRLAVLAGGLELRPRDLPSSTLAAPAGVVLAAGGGRRAAARGR